MKDIIDAVVKIVEVRTAISRKEAMDLNLPSYINNSGSNQNGTLVAVLMHTEIDNWPHYFGAVFNSTDSIDSRQLDLLMESADISSRFVNELKDGIVRVLLEGTKDGLKLLAFGSSKVDRCYILNGDGRAYSFKVAKARLM